MSIAIINPYLHVFLILLLITNYSCKFHTHSHFFVSELKTPRFFVPPSLPSFSDCLFPRLIVSNHSTATPYRIHNSLESRLRTSHGSLASLPNKKSKTCLQVGASYEDEI